MSLLCKIIKHSAIAIIKNKTLFYSKMKNNQITNVAKLVK